MKKSAITRRFRVPAKVLGVIVAVGLLPIAGAALPPSHAMAIAQKAHRAERLSIDGEVVHPQALTLADLKREPATTETVSIRTGKGMLTGQYTGVLLWTLLRHATMKLSHGSRNDVLRHTVVVTGSDGYATVLSTAEIDPQFGAERAIIAYAKDGKPLPADRGGLRLIFPADKMAGRAIWGVVRITVR